MITQQQKQEIRSALSAKYPGAKIQFKKRKLSHSEKTYIHIEDFPDPMSESQTKDPRFIILALIQESLPTANMTSCGAFGMTVAEF